MINCVANPLHTPHDTPHLPGGPGRKTSVFGVHLQDGTLKDPGVAQRVTLRQQLSFERQLGNVLHNSHAMIVSAPKTTHGETTATTKRKLGLTALRIGEQAKRWAARDRSGHDDAQYFAAGPPAPQAP